MSCGSAPKRCAPSGRLRGSRRKDPEIDGALWRAYRWLDEAIGHLEVIRPEVRHKFRLGDYLTFDRLQLDSGFAAFPPPRARDRRQARARRDVLPARGAQARRRPGEHDGGGERRGAAASRGASFPQRHRALDKDKVVRNTLFHVEPMIRASVRFKPDYRRHAIDEAALEDLVHLVLGESNAFLHRAPLAYVNSRK